MATESRAPDPVSDQPFFAGMGDELTDHGKRSRDETFSEIGDTAGRCRIWLARIIAAGKRGITRDELSAATGVPQNAFSGRITELKNHEPPLIQDTRERRPTRSGSTASVIVATEWARNHLNPSPHPELPVMSTKTVPACELPDASPNEFIPVDETGNPIEAGCRYIVPGFGRAETFYEIDEDEMYVFPANDPAKRQRVDMMPPQETPWQRID